VGNSANYILAVNRRIEKLLASGAMGEPDLGARTWFGQSGTNQVWQVTEWAKATFHGKPAPPTAVPPVPVRNWDMWQDSLEWAIDIFKAGPMPGDPAAQIAWDWFRDGPTPPGTTGDAPPEAIDWVLEHLPIIVFPRTPVLAAVAFA
jgi:hypothetical protein